MSPPDVRCISLHQPWATLVALGEKSPAKATRPFPFRLEPDRSRHQEGLIQIETRSWHTRYRGRLLVHASRAKPNAMAMRDPAIAAALARHGVGVEDLPLGAIVASVNLIDCWAIAKTLVAGAMPVTAPLLVTSTVAYVIDDELLPFGDFRPGRFAWMLGGLQRFTHPILMPGQQGLWRPPREAMESISRQTIASW